MKAGATLASLRVRLQNQGHPGASMLANSYGRSDPKGPLKSVSSSGSLSWGQRSHAAITSITDGHFRGQRHNGTSKKMTSKKKKNSRGSQASPHLVSYGFSFSKWRGRVVNEEKDPHVVGGTASWDLRSQWSPSSQVVSTGHSCPATVT